MSDLITIVIPVKNTNAIFLKECLDSIQQQTYATWEAIIVDDNSEKECKEAILSIANRDKRFKLIEGNFGSPAKARNDGLKITIGKYITFVDSDDKLAPNALEILHDQINKSKVDIVQLGFYYWQSNGLWVDERKVKHSDGLLIFERDEAIEALLDSQINNFLWGKIYKKKVFDSLPLPEVVYYEDLLWMHKAIDKCSKIAILNLPIYFYRQHRGSLTAQPRKYATEFVTAIESRCNFIADKYPYLKSKAYRRLWQTAFEYCYDKKDCLSQELWIAINKKYKKDFDKYIYNSFLYNSVKKERKLLIRIYRFCSKIFNHFFAPKLTKK